MKRCTRGLEKIYEPAILLIISKKPSYGYEIRKNLEKEYGCRVNFGNLYRCLNKFLEKEFIRLKKEKSDVGPERNVYELTEKGKKYLNEWRKDLEEEKKRIEKILTNLKVKK